MSESNLNKMIVSYISNTQPKLEKYALEKESFLTALNTKLTSFVKAGAMSKAESDKIYKAASNNPANILNYLDIPQYQRSYGSVVEKKAGQVGYDPIEEFCLKR